MSPWAPTSGTVVDVLAVLAVLLGSAPGMALRRRLPARTVTTVMRAIGLAAVFIGIASA